MHHSINYSLWNTHASVRDETGATPARLRLIVTDDHGGRLLSDAAGPRTYPIVVRPVATGPTTSSLTSSFDSPAPPLGSASAPRSCRTAPADQASAPHAHPTSTWCAPQRNWNAHRAMSRALRSPQPYQPGPPPSGSNAARSGSDGPADGVASDTGRESWTASSAHPASASRRGKAANDAASAGAASEQRLVSSQASAMVRQPIVSAQDPPAPWAGLQRPSPRRV
jgi:hypothetical protein